MELTARLTEDAIEATAKGGAKVLNFTVVDNDAYKPKGAKEFKKVSTFFSCSYWQGGQVAQVLRKGAIITLQGRIGARPYLRGNGEPASELTFHVNNFKVVQYAKRPGEAAQTLPENSGAPDTRTEEEPRFEREKDDKTPYSNSH